MMNQAEEHAPEHRVKSLELFFDLVFVLAFTQVTSKLADDLTYEGILRSLLVLAVLWWAWAGYAWLTNAFDPESKLMRLPIFIAMGALLIASLAVPKAFGEYAAYFAVAYMIVRLVHLSFYLIGSRGDAEQTGAVLRLMPVFILAPALILVSVAFDGQVQAAFWLLAIAVDYGGAFFFAGDGWNLEPDHFAERFGLIIIIALGESIVSIGVGAEGVTLDFQTVLAAILAITLASAMWWMYFDVLALVAAKVLQRLTGLERLRLALHTYAMLHFLLIAGIIFSALAIKKTVGHPDEHLKEIPAVALGAGIALYAGGLSAIRKRDIGMWNWFRLAAAVVSLALIPVFKEVSALTSIAIVTGMLLLLVVTELIYYREVRTRVRATT